MSAGLRGRFNMGLVEMLSNGEEGNIAERYTAKALQVTVGKDHAGYNVFVHAMVCAPVVVIGLDQNLRNFAETSLR